MSRRDPDQLTIPPDGLPDELQPQWRKDFPIDWPQDEFIARRDFAKFLVLTSFSFTVGQIWIAAQNFFRSQSSSDAMEIVGVDELPVGGSHSFRYPGEHDDCLLVRTGPQEFVAFSQKCTHLSCPVKPDYASRSLICPCHNGSFDMMTGVPTGGPPRRPLPTITLKVEKGRVFATGVVERPA